MLKAYKADKTTVIHTYICDISMFGWLFFFFKLGISDCVFFQTELTDLLKKRRGKKHQEKKM